MASLDPMIRSDLQEDLRAIFRRLETTVVLVTHDLAEAVYLADSIVLMRAGQIEQVAAGSDLMSAPANDFVTTFVRAQRYLRGRGLCMSARFGRGALTLMLLSSACASGDSAAAAPVS